jgi:ketosteroid isomerase-like protein
MKGMSEVLAAVEQANAAFYKALETLDLQAMDGLWLHEPFVRCVHPGREVLAGWETVRQSWQQIFENTRWMRVTATGVDVVVFGDVGIVSCAEDITATRDEDVGLGVAQATNVFIRTPEGWRMVVHHASPAPVRVTQPFSGTVQ